MTISQPSALRILCVEDEPDILRDIAEELRENGFCVDAAENAEVALGLATANAPDLILCDVQMPGMNGIEFLGLLRGRDDALGTVPFILLTAFNDREHMLDARKAGADDYLVKPVDYDLLVATLSAHLDNVARRTRPTEAAPPDQLPGRSALLASLRDCKDDAQLAIFSVDNPSQLVRRLGRPLEDHLARLSRRKGLKDRVRFFHFEGFDFAALIQGGASGLDSLLPYLTALRIRDRGSPQDAASLITASVATSPVAKSRDHDQLLDRLLGAMRLIQGEGGARHLSLDDPELDELRAARTLRAQILPAIARGEFHLNFQPRISLRNGKVIGAEALLRWTSPEHGIVPPDRAIAIAERAGLIRQVSDWVFSEIARAQTWLKGQGHRLRFGVNVSAEEFDDALLPRITQALEAHGAHPELIDVEITETALADDLDKTLRVAHLLRRHGMTVAVDDFGTGYSSLSYIGKLPIDTVKIDQSFIRDMDQNPTHRQVVTSVVDLSRSLGLQSVAEGVETDAQLELLRSMGCDAVQGFFTGPPMSLEDLAARLDKDRVTA